MDRILSIIISVHIFAIVEDELIVVRVDGVIDIIDLLIDFRDAIRLLLFIIITRKVKNPWIRKRNVRSFLSHNLHSSEPTNIHTKQFGEYFSQLEMISRTNSTCKTFYILISYESL